MAVSGNMPPVTRSWYSAYEPQNRLWNTILWTLPNFAWAWAWAWVSSHSWVDVISLFRNFGYFTKSVYTWHIVWICHKGCCHKAMNLRCFLLPSFTKGYWIIASPACIGYHNTLFNPSPTTHRFHIPAKRFYSTEIADLIQPLVPFDVFPDFLFLHNAVVVCLAVEKKWDRRHNCFALSAGQLLRPICSTMQR